METYLRDFDWAELFDIALEFGADVWYDDTEWEIIQAILHLNLSIQDIEEYLDEEYIPY